MVDGTQVEVLNTLNSEHATDRDIYDHVVDYLSEQRCFLGPSGGPCMFESYGTIIQFARVEEALAPFSVEHRGAISRALQGFGSFTPLATILAAVIGRI